MPASRRRLALSAALVAVAAVGAPAAGDPSRVLGTYALQGGAPHGGLALRLRPPGRDPLLRGLDFRFGAAPKSSAPPLSFEARVAAATGVAGAAAAAGGLPLDVTLVSNDLDAALRVPAVLGPGGRAVVPARFPATGRWHVYAGFTPPGAAPAVVRYDVAIGGPGEGGAADTAPTGRVVLVDGYAVTVARTRLRAGRASDVGVTFSKRGAPATDLRAAYGADGAAFAIDAGDLTYVPAELTEPRGAADAMAALVAGAVPSPVASGAPKVKAAAHVPPELDLRVRLGEPGAYRLWVLFRGGGALHAAAFTLTAR